ncbi:MAG: TatD family deoxyribonuclease [Verrucomicrobia bacterium]|nr:MAG: TatD family deoxyribonuclease [Verrucomicrobiota bacterium]
MPLHDAHNHLQDAHLVPHLQAITSEWPTLAGRDSSMIVNATHPDDWGHVTALANAHPFVRPAYGIHPWDTGTPRSADWLAQLRACLVADPRASVGEIGLDRWILDNASRDDLRLAGMRRAPLEEQVSTFVPQLALAAEYDRPASIHCLHAYDDLLPLLRLHALPKVGFLLHAYSGTARLVPDLVALGAYFSFNPSFLAPYRTRQQSAFRAIPQHRLLCETDAPAMLPPAAWRDHQLPHAPDGTQLNPPGNITAAYAGLAILRQQDPAALAEQIDENFKRLFAPVGIPDIATPVSTRPREPHDRSKNSPTDNYPPSP